ncbi:hypothetical protein [Humitalea rosea]|uniref:hypothetical protein n=1 Tax=Humitalea rosea TaxID=990373 RepID=UPI000DABB33A|nr:hypothetical protein [Humitalea rosea]
MAGLSCVGMDQDAPQAPRTVFCRPLMILEGQRRYHHHNDGEILWAAPHWLHQTLSYLRKRLVYSITLSKYRSTREYDQATDVKAVFIVLMTDDPKFQIWHEKKESSQNY